LFASGVESKIVQAQMRHRDIATTHKHYEFAMRTRGYNRDQLENADILKLGKREGKDVAFINLETSVTPIVTHLL